jgi:hypothetical protein
MVFKCPIFSWAARLWYDINYAEEVAAGEAITWQILESDLLKHFNSKAYVELANAKLAFRLQEEAESFESYYFDVLTLCQTIDLGMSELQKIGHLMRGMQSALVEMLYPLGLKTERGTITASS